RPEYIIYQMNDPHNLELFMSIETMIDEQGYHDVYHFRTGPLLWDRPALSLPYGVYVKYSDIPTQSVGLIRYLLADPDTRREYSLAYTQGISQRLINVGKKTK